MAKGRAKLNEPFYWQGEGSFGDLFRPFSLPLPWYEKLSNQDQIKDKRKKLLELQAQVEICHKCPDLVYSRRLYPYGKPTFGYGNPNSPIVFIGEAPGKDGCGTTGIPFTKDRSGEYYQHTLKAKLGLSLDDVWTTNMVKCCPENNRTPTNIEIRNCLPFLVGELSIVDPLVIVPMGKIALSMFYPDIEQNQPMPYYRAIATPLVMKGQGDIQTIWRELPVERVWGHPVMLLPIYHPAFILRDPTHERDFKQCFLKAGNLAILQMEKQRVGSM